MKNILLVLAFSLFLGGCSLPFSANTVNTKTNEELHTLQTSDTNNTGTGVSSRSGTELGSIQDHYAVEGLLLEGEKYLSGDLYALALRKFLSAYETSPDDTYIAEKIADTYVQMHKYNLAYKYYEKLGENLNEEQTDKKFLSLIYSSDLSASGELDKIVHLVPSLPVSAEKKFYYVNSLYCIVDFHLCKKNFGDKIDSIGTGTLIPEMQNIKDAINAYTVFQVDDVSYKNALVIGAFLKNKMYPLSTRLGEKILLEKPDYKPVMEIIAQSYYDMGDMENAKARLEKLLKIDPSNKNVNYLMGVIQNQLREFILSNIFLTKALDLGYEPKIDIQRRLIYNAFELDQKEAMLKGLKSIIFDEKDFEAGDAYVAIYYHIINGKSDVALEIAEKALEKYDTNGNLYGYIGWIYKDRSDLGKATEYLEKGLQYDPTSPLLLLNFGQLSIKKGLVSKSVIYLKKTIKEDVGGQFGEQAAKELEKISSGVLQDVQNK